jgi:dihydrofolate reductase
MRLFIAQSIDGRIADPKGGTGFLDPYPGEAFGYADFIATVDAVVMGRATYDHMMREWGWAYPGKRGLIMTRKPLPSPPLGVEAVPVDPSWVAGTAPDAWVVGGGRTIAGFLEAGLVTEARLFTVPVLLGAGVPLFPAFRPGQGLNLLGARAHPGGVVETIWRGAA